jgi:ribosomal protein S3
MGQKIHPLGFRVGITKRHQTVWFARFEKRQYAQTVLEDIFLRKTLEKLLPELLRKKYNNSDQIAKIAHIKIERGLIPYEIGIQIHAQNCEAIKTAVDKLEINPNILKNVLKNKFVLEKALKNQDMLHVKATATSDMDNAKTSTSKTKTRDSGGMFQKMSKTGKFGDRRFQKRQTMLERFRERILENMLIIKKGKKITRKFQKAEAKPVKFGRQRNNTFNRNQPKSQTRFGGNAKAKFRTKATATDFSNLSTARLRSILTENREQSQKTTKFMNVFLAKMNRQFQNALKSDLVSWNTYLENYKADQLQKYGKLRYAPVGYQTKWSFARLKRYENQPLNVLVKLLKVLQKQALRKFDLLRKEYFVLGRIPQMKSFAYFQRIRFIKALKNFIQQAKVTLTSKQKQTFGNSGTSQSLNVQKQLENAQLLQNLKDKGLNLKLTNIKNETRKVRFVEHLQHLVQKHRQKNLYLYLATISDSRKYLRQIQKFTKQQATFLFGINPSVLEQMNPEQKREFVKNQLKKSIEKANRQNDLQRNLQEVFVRQIQQQKRICIQNLALMPKISFKFYSLKQETVETNASIVTATIVDKLEKREAFRKVIKKVSEDLMKTSKVKGVKIQVSGRLNGAEIARSEWVRAGRVPLQTLRANIDYCYKTAQTIYGIIGVKVWIYRGYTKRNKNA